MASSCVCRIFLLIFLSGWVLFAQGVEYVVHVYTADKHLAGTNADVYVKFIGKKGKLPETKLQPRSSDPYEQNSHDVARITSSYLGELSEIEVKRSSGDIWADWDLDKIVVEDPENKFEYTFKCNCDIDEKHKWWKVAVVKPFGCRHGYRLVNEKCEDVDECQNSDACRKDPHATCTNTDGSFHCRKCKPGYSYHGDKCTDVNECNSDQRQCKQRCLNTEGSYACACFSGYALAGKYDCEDIDECAKGTHQCEHRAKCLNHPGGYSCQCPSGYETDPNDKLRCKNENECLKASACDDKTSVKCIDYDGGYKCECKPGFHNEKDNVCKDINECQGRNTCDPRTSVCENLEGSYRCKCSPGFIPSVNGKSCIARKCNPLVIPNGANVRQARCTQKNANNFNDVCTFYCIAGYFITDPAHTELVCGADTLWKGTLPTCQPVKCPPLQVPASGRIRPASCSSGATFKQSCSFICKDGYEVGGVDEVKCLSDGTWSDSVPTCNKVASALWITCPPSISVDLKPGASTADISRDWQTPQTSNAKYLTSSHKKTDPFPAGTSFVTWSVSNDNVNFKTCTVAVEVNDKEKPVAVNCPSREIFVWTKNEKELVKLPNVQFTDNVAVKFIKYSYPNPVEIKKDDTKTVIVSARDTSGNLGQCIFEVHVKEATCPTLASPVNGTASCSDAGFYRFCQLFCNGNKVIFNATGKWSSRLWDCQKPSLVWEPTPAVPDCVDFVNSDGSSCPDRKVLITTTLPQDAATNVNVCGDCPSGTYYENKECKRCPAGTYQTKTGQSGLASCINCPLDTSSKPGSKQFTECKAVCPAGFFSVDGFQPCELCPVGEYQSKVGSTSCNRCPRDSSCTRHQGASSIVKCGPCPSISRIVPSGSVKRTRGSLLEVFCYMGTNMSQYFNIRWAFKPDTPGQSLGSKMYQKKLRDVNGKQIGIKLSVRDLRASASFQCVLENLFGIAEKAVHVAVIDAVGSGRGMVNDEELPLGF